MAKEPPEEHARLVRLDALAAAETGPVADGIPSRWLHDPTWRCVNQHISKH